ncbi:MAG: Na/Pi cotransporter family protein [Anaerovoracaceae bacterium]|jgi:phosphate:Na+ symporter
MSLLEFFSLLGGVGLFLFGMTTMSDGLKSACGDDLQLILEKATTNKVIAVFVGLAMTMLIQSSSATDVMVIGFVNAGMMNLSQAIGVIMGANIGTTITAQITAFDLASYAPVLLFVGAIMYLFMKRSMVKYIGEVIMGFGMLFVGISIMKAAIAPLSESKGFIQFLSGLDNPAIALLFGVGFTALLQSSSSSTVIFQTFAVQGLLGYHTAVYLVIGAAIGSVTPNLLAGLTANRNGKRTAILNLVFNLIRAALLVTLINIFPHFLDLIQSLSPNDIGRQIANTHTIFAIIAVLCELPFSNYIIRLVEKLIPILPDENEQLEDRKLQYMTNLSNIPTSMALAQAHREIVRMGRIAAKNLHHALDCFFHYTPDKAESVRVREESVNILNHTINSQLTQLRGKDLNSNQMRILSNLTITISDFERLSDHAENIVEYTEDLVKTKSSMSEDAHNELVQMSEDARNSVDLSIDIFDTQDYSHLDELEALEDRLDEQETRLIHNHLDRLMNYTCEPMAGVVFCDMVTALERCGDHAINIAYSMKEYPMEKIHVHSQPPTP